MDPTDRDYGYEYDEEPPPSGRILWGRVITLGVVLLLAFVLGRCSVSTGASDQEVEALEQQVTDLIDENGFLEAQIRAMEAGGAESTAPAGTDGPGSAGNADDEGDDHGDDEPADEGDDDSDASADDEGDESAAVRTHRVEAGDYLYTLAEHYYGDTDRWRLIADANGLSREDPTIRPGQVLEIPPAPDEG